MVSTQQLAGLHELPITQFNLTGSRHLAVVPVRPSFRVRLAITVLPTLRLTNDGRTLTRSTTTKRRSQAFGDIFGRRHLIILSFGQSVH